MHPDYVDLKCDRCGEPLTMTREEVEMLDRGLEIHCQKCAVKVCKEALEENRPEGEQ